MSLDPNNPEVLTSVRTEMEVAAVVSALVAQGVPSTTTGSFTAGFRAEAPGYVSVVVRKEDLNRPRHARAETELVAPQVDWPQIDGGELAED